ncbi:hypothetical protein [Thalassobacillus devorans]|nr:hypothetical protein [Thalassobacillus devorans]
MPDPHSVTNLTGKGSGTFTYNEFSDKKRLYILAKKELTILVYVVIL